MNRSPVAEISWCRDKENASRLAKLFFDNLTSSYISHSEIQGPRAIAPGVWAPDIAELLLADAVSRIGSSLDPAAGSKSFLAAGMKADGETVGVFFVTFSREGAVPFCVLEDMVVAAACRGRGYGDLFMKWIDDECRQRGIFRIFLESGNDNHRAHELFHREGFEQVSVVMMKELPGQKPTQ